MSATTLTFLVTVADIPPSGTVQLNVFNPPPGGGTSNTVTIQFTTVPPALTGISPSEATQGDSGFTLHVSGSSFFQSSVVKWNGAALPTTYISGTRLDAQISSTLLLQAGVAQVTVFTDGPANGAFSTPQPFTVRQHYATLAGTVVLRANALSYNSAQNRLYASAPSIAGTTYGNSIVEIDTSSAPTIASTAFIGSEPGKLALSDDGSTLFVELRGAPALRKYDTNTHTPGLQFTLGPDPLFNTYAVGDMQVVPGSNTALAVSRMTPNTSPGFAGVAVYDDGVKRPNETPRYFASAADRIEFGASPSTLFGLGINDSSLSTVQIDANGATNIDSKTGFLQGFDFKWDAGRLYTTSGQVVDPANKTLIGNFVLSGLQVFQVVPDTANGRVYFVGSNNIGKVITTYSASTFGLLDTVSLPAFDGELAAVAYLGNGRFAIASDHGTIFFVSVVPAPTTAPTPSLTRIAPNWAVQGSTPFTLQVNGGSFLPTSIVKWNGKALVTTYVSDTILNAQIGAAELSVAGIVQVTVFNPGSGNGATSAAASFSVVEHNATVTSTLPLRADALQFNRTNSRLYASVPGSAGVNYGNSLVEIDTTGVPAISTSTFVGSEPGALTLSGDGSTLYVALRGIHGVRKFDTMTHTPGVQFGLGADLNNGGVYDVDDMEFVPGSNTALVVSRMNLGITPRHGGVAVFDDGVQRPNTTPGHTGANRIEFGTDPATVFGLSSDSAGFFAIQVDSNGAKVVNSDPTFAGQDMKWDSDRLYSTSGQVFDPNTKAIVGTFPPTQLSLSAVVPDVANQRVYFVGRDQNGKWIRVYDPGHFTPSDSFAIPGFVGEIIAVAYLGTGQFAIASDSGTIYFVSATPSSSQTTQPSISSLLPNQAFEGMTFGGSLQVLGARFSPNSVVKWNGTALRTSYDSSSRLFADVSSTLLAQAGTAQVSVFTDGPGGGATSNSVPLPILGPQSPLPTSSLSVPSSAMVYDPTRKTLFVTSAGSLVEIDTSGIPFVSHSTFVGNNPGPLAISDDASTLFVGPQLASFVFKFDISTHSLGAQIPLGSAPFSTNPYRPAALAVLPGSTMAVAVSRRDASEAGVAIYDQNGQRTNETSRFLSGTIFFCSPSPYLFLFNGALNRVQVDSSGATLVDSTRAVLGGRNIRCHDGRLYSSQGQIVDTTSLASVGQYTAPPNIGFISFFDILPNANGRTYVVADGYYEKVLLTYDRDTFVFLQKSSLIGIPSSANFTAVADLGDGRIAIGTDEGKIYFVTVP